MLALSDILPAVTCNAVMPKEPNPGLMTMAGRTNQLIEARNTPLTENQLTAIASHVLRQPFAIICEDRKIYGRKRFTDENGEYWLDEQVIGTKVTVDCVVDARPEVSKAMLLSALRISPPLACLTHLTHLAMHKKFGTTDQDRTIMLNDYVCALQGFPEFVIYKVCEHYWENDKRPFVPFIDEIKQGCQVFQAALQRLLNIAENKDQLQITKQQAQKPKEQPWSRPTEADIAAVAKLAKQARMICGES
jgi:hypothetical protein